MVGASPELFKVLFADDSNVFLSGRNIDTVIEEVNSALTGIVNWLQINKLTLNIKKKHYIIFTKSKGSVATNTPVYVNGEQIERVSCTRFLGVMLDEKLDFNNHIKHVKSKVAKGIYILGRAKKFFDEITIKELYYAFVHPYLIYCHEVWGGTYSTYLKPLLIIQKRAVRIIAGVPRRHHSLELFQRYNIVPFDKLYEYSQYIFIFKLVNHLHPQGIQTLFPLNNQIHYHHTRQATNIHFDPVSFGIKKRGFRHKISLFHDTHTDVDYTIPISSFKFVVKTTLLNQDGPEAED